MAIITRTPRQIITSSLKALGILGQSDDLENEQATDGLNAINELLASWGVDRNIAHVLDRQTYTLTAGQGSYTIGTGGDFNTDRPVDIADNGYISSGSVDYPLRCFTRPGYNWIADKTSQDRPTRLYYDPDYPLGKIYFDYVPSSAFTIVIDVQIPIASIATLDTTIVLPPEYARALKWNLCLELAPDYEINPRKGIQDNAEESLNMIRANNATIEPLRFDAALVPAGATAARTIESG